MENLNAQIPLEPLDKILSLMDLEKLNMYEVVKKVYEATYMKYHIKFFEEKAMREKLEARIIKKNTELDAKDVKLLHACGWWYAKACSLLDEGKDIRKITVPELMDLMSKELEDGQEGTPVSEDSEAPAQGD